MSKLYSEKAAAFTPLDLTIEWLRVGRFLVIRARHSITGGCSWIENWAIPLMRKKMVTVRNVAYTASTKSMPGNPHFHDHQL